MKRFFELLLLLAVAIISLGSCNGASQPTDQPKDQIPVDGTGSETLRLPFVEEVILPPKITADTDFVVTLKLSAALHPQTLRSGNHAPVGLPGATGANFLMEDGRFHGYKIQPYFFPLPDHDTQQWGKLEEWGSIVDRKELTFHAPPAGNYRFVVDSAISAAFGGMELQVQEHPVFLPQPNDNVKQIEVPFVVEE
jgi:hypothetical protein